MPGGDRTGPRGEGPKTGWGLGDCAGENQPGYSGSRPTSWMGRGFRSGGRGRGWRNRFYDFGTSGQLPSQDFQDLDALKTQNQELQTTLQKISERLDKLEK
jgi:hypothetical protein